MCKFINNKRAVYWQLVPNNNTRFILASLFLTEIKQLIIIVKCFKAALFQIPDTQEAFK